MTFFHVCKLCSSSHFKRVHVRLPSGKERVTDFEACENCKLVYFLPERRDHIADDAQLQANKRHLPIEVIDKIKAALPSPELETVKEEITERYRHPELGLIELIFRRMRKAAYKKGEQGALIWYLDSARLLVDQK